MFSHDSHTPEVPYSSILCRESSETELRGQLREQGVEDISKVKAAYIESDGRISVIKYEQTPHEKTERQET